MTTSVTDTAGNSQPTVGHPVPATLAPRDVLADTVAAALAATGASPATITAARTTIAAGQVYGSFSRAAQATGGGIAELFGTADNLVQRAIDHQNTPADEAPLEPGAESYGVKAGNARGNILNAEVFTTDDENPAERVSKISVWSHAADADLDLQQTDQFLTDLQEFIPRLRALRNHLATVEDRAINERVAEQHPHMRPVTSKSTAVCVYDGAPAVTVGTGDLGNRYGLCAGCSNSAAASA